MKTFFKILLISTVLVFSFLFLSAGSTPPGTDDMTGFFPEVTSMKKGTPAIYTAGNLYEYIDGAAEVFLSFDFQKLASLTYEDEQKHSLTIDIYRHNNHINGFGIYSQEKPLQGDFLPIGAEGYYEKGVLNFFKGSYYVKMSAFDMGDKEKEMMMKAANAVAAKLPGPGFLPLPITCFPGKDRVLKSERYIARDFLGHGFLHSAFISDYENKESGRKFQIFLMQGKDRKEAEKFVNDYLEFAKKKGVEVSVHKKFYRFLDPYYRSKGSMNIMSRGKYAWGMFGDDLNEVHYYIDTLEKNLEKLHSSF